MSKQFRVKLEFRVSATNSSKAFKGSDAMKREPC